VWEQTDYGDRLPWTPAVLETVAPSGGTDYESRQCVVLGAGAMAAQKHPQDEHPKTAVVAKAQSIRGQQLTQSLQCQAALGPMPAYVHPVEGELHAQAHDNAEANHEKDHRHNASFPTRELEGVHAVTFRVDFWGKMKVEELVPGPKWGRKRARLTSINKQH